MNCSLTAWPIAALLTLSISPAWAQIRHEASQPPELPPAYRQINELFDSVSEMWRQHFHCYGSLDLVDEAFVAEFLGLIPYDLARGNSEHETSDEQQAAETSVDVPALSPDAAPLGEWNACEADYYAQDASENYLFQDAFPADKSWSEVPSNYGIPPEPIDFTVVIPALGDFCQKLAQLEPVQTLLSGGQSSCETLGQVVQESAEVLYYTWHDATLVKHLRYKELYRELDQYAGLDWECFPLDQPGPIAPSQEVLDANRSELLLSMARGLDRMGTALQQWSQHLSRLAETEAGISSASGNVEKHSLVR